MKGKCIRIVINIIIIIIIMQLQLYGFNSQLYTNLSVAREFPGGVVGVSIMLQVLFILFDYFIISIVIALNFTFFITMMIVFGEVVGVSIMVWVYHII